MPQIICATLAKGTKREIQGSESVWSAVWPDAAISACLHDMGEYAKKEKVTDTYLTELSTWLTSGDDARMIYIENGDQIDVWQYDDERD